MVTQKDPFRSARLFYRAVNGAADDAFFARINEDRFGYMNSNISNNRLPGPEDAQRWRKSMEDNLLSAIICLPQIISKVEGPNEEKAGTPIGQIHLNGIPTGQHHHRNTEVGIDILPEFQGKGYGSEAIWWVLEYAFKRAGLHRVRIRAFEWNEGACSLYQRLGFVLEGREREALFHEGRFWDGFQFGMIDREWFALQEEQRKKRKEAESQNMI